MCDLSDSLKADFQVDVQKLPSDRFPGKLTQYEDVVKAHYLICDYFETVEGVGSLHGIKNVDMLCSAIARQTVTFAGKTKWTDEFEIAATLFYGLIKNHPFHDGNKRTALLVLLNHLCNIQRVPNAPQKDFEKLTVNIAESNFNNVNNQRQKNASDMIDACIRDVARKLRKMTRPRDNNFSPVTYLEFARALSKFGYFFRDPYHNTIDIYKRTPHVNFLGIQTRKMDEIKVCNIAFPGMKRQVTRETIKEILKMLGMTPQTGFDRKCIFEDAEPMYKLIQDYESVLRKLRDK